MQLKQFLLEATRFLKENEIESARLDAEILTGHVLGKDRIFFYTYPDHVVTEEDQNKIMELLRRRAAHEPVAYLTGSKEFMGLEFMVSPNVLIPRPDTEILVETILEKIGDQKVSVLDLCSGSGAIGLSLKSIRPDIEVTLSDISKEATEISEINKKNLGIDCRIIVSNLFDDIDQKFDFIVSNPPYIKSSDIEELSEEIKSYEPRLALDGGNEGYIFYDRIVRESKSHLKKGGCLAFELGDGQAERVREMLTENNFTNIQTFRDLAGIERVILAYRS